MRALIRKFQRHFGGGRRPAKIVGLMPARNEGVRILFALKALAQHTDAIVYLDDCSTDDTLDLVKSCQQECRVERVLEKAEWLRDETADRNRLLEAGREIGGTHFIVIDADEALTSNFLKRNFLRRKILGLSPGDQLNLRWIHLWRSTERYRTDGDKGVKRFKGCIFCDDGVCRYAWDFIHTPRVPVLGGRQKKLRGSFGLMHFQFVDWDNLCLKQKWYHWLERVRFPDRPVDQILGRYVGSTEEEGLKTAPRPDNWFETYDFFDPAAFHKPDVWRIEQMAGWEREKGSAYFDRLG